MVDGDEALTQLLLAIYKEYGLSMVGCELHYNSPEEMINPHGGSMGTWRGRWLTLFYSGWQSIRKLRRFSAWRLRLPA